MHYAVHTDAQVCCSSRNESIDPSNTLFENTEKTAQNACVLHHIFHVGCEKQIWLVGRAKSNSRTGRRTMSLGPATAEHDVTARALTATLGEGPTGSADLTRASASLYSPTSLLQSQPLSTSASYVVPRYNATAKWRQKCPALST